MAIVLQFAIGLMFGLGLLISGMSDPAKGAQLSRSGCDWFGKLGSEPRLCDGWCRRHDLCRFRVGAEAAAATAWRTISSADQTAIGSPNRFGSGHFRYRLGFGGLLSGSCPHGARLRLASSGDVRRRHDGRHAARALACQSPRAVAHRHTGGFGLNPHRHLSLRHCAIQPALYLICQSVVGRCRIVNSI
jgi:hypothetical protein